MAKKIDEDNQKSLELNLEFENETKPPDAIGWKISIKCL